MRLDVRADGTKRVEAFGAGELDVTLLKVARSDVVEARVAEEIGQGIIGVAELRTAEADNDGELAFVLDAPGIGREHDRLVRADDGRRGVKKEEWRFGDHVCQVGGGRGVISAHANGL